MTKKSVTAVSLAYVVYFLIILLVSGFCDLQICRIRDDDLLGRVLYLLMPLGPVFFLSLITYKMRDEVFRAWWKFASWFVPFLIVMTWFIEWMPKEGGGWAGLYSELPYQFLGLLYGIFVLVSLTKIFLAYRRSKA